MKIKQILFLAVLVCLALVSCESYDKRPDGSVSYKSLGTDADATVIDGPLPVFAGLIPVYNDKGVVIGQRPIYTAGTSTERVGFASFGSNQSRGLKSATDLVDNSIKGYFGLKALTRYFDSQDATTAADAATRGKEIDAGTTQAQIASDERLALEKLKMEEEAAAALPTPATP